MTLYIGKNKGKNNWYHAGLIIKRLIIGSLSIILSESKMRIDQYYLFIFLSYIKVTTKIKKGSLEVII